MVGVRALEQQKRQFSPGESATFVKTITSADIEIFAALSGDHNPLHLNSEYAAKTRFKQRIAHGMLTASLISTVIGMYLPGPGAIYLGQELKFIKAVFVDDTITASVTMDVFDQEKKLMTLKTSCINQHGETVLRGEAKVRYEPV